LLTSFGMPQAFAEILADSDHGLARGDLLVEGDDLRTLIGRPTTTPADAIRSAVAASELGHHGHRSSAAPPWARPHMPRFAANECT
jgi:hypothetical protein